MYYLSLGPLNKSHPIAQIKGGENDGKKVYICESEQNNDEGFGCLIIKDGIFIPIPTIDSRACSYVSGCSGSGKSYYVAQYVEQLKKIYPDIKFYLISKKQNDKVLDNLNPIRLLKPGQEILELPENMKNSVFVFDDVDTIDNKKLYDQIKNLRNDLLQVGRSDNIYVLTTSHQLMDYNNTRTILSESHCVTVFPKRGSDYHINRYFKIYAGLDKDQIKRIMNLKTRWVTFYTHAPQYILSEHECYLMENHSNYLPLENTSDGDIINKTKLLTPINSSLKGGNQLNKDEIKIIDDVINSLKKHALSSEDVLKICNGKANLLTYPELAKYDNINNAMGKYEALILLYESRKNYGHWCCVFRRDSNTLEFFDPYSGIPDSELKFIDINFRRKNNELKPHLLTLMAKTGNKIIYNDHKLQKLSSDVATCGRWVGLRLLLRKWDIDKFNSFFRQNKEYPPDFIATILTIF